MAIIARYTPQPSDNLDYDVRYDDFLSEGDSLAYGTATVSPVGLVVQSPMVVGQTLKLWVSGGVAGVKYKVTLRAFTTLGREKEDELIFKVKEV